MSRKTHKLLLGNITPPALREVTYLEAYKKAKQFKYFYYEIDSNLDSSLKKSISFLLNLIYELDFGLSVGLEYHRFKV